MKMDYFWLGASVVGMYAGLADRSMKIFFWSAFIFFVALGTVAGVLPLY